MHFCFSNLDCFEFFSHKLRATRGFFAVNNVICMFTGKNNALSELTQLI